MDQVSAGDTTHQGARTRRRRMREQARSQHAFQTPVSDRYQTPEWLERSFVLPLTQPEATDVPSDVPGELPSQSVPHHDDDPAVEPDAVAIEQSDAEAPTAPPASPAYVRPPSADIDFGKVVRRSDLTRKVTWLHWIATGLAGLALVAYLLVSSTVLLDVVIVLAVVALVSFAVRVWLNHAPVPRLQR
ncbi:MAG: hypothetical protein ABWY19_05770 [Marmoricola sp.]